jgi:hypothetical protein
MTRDDFATAHAISALRHSGRSQIARGPFMPSGTGPPHDAHGPSGSYCGWLRASAHVEQYEVPWPRSFSPPQPRHGLRWSLTAPGGF